MATTSIPHRWKYDVFVSFRGEDIRKNFMDHMFNDFKQKGIHAFRDDTQLPKGEEISPHLDKAIEESRFLIVIFSKNYASSSWCLRELVKILKCKEIEDPKHEFQVIFYDVKPEVVRKQTGSYAEAFAKHQVSNRLEVDNWKEALSKAASLSGWDLQDMTNGYEYKFIDCISNDILKNLCVGPLHVDENLVGIDFHFDKLDLSRFIGSDKVNMIGLCGISGIGKTTLAKAIYNLMYAHFEGSCFCEDVRKQQDLTQVQMQLIDDIMKTRELKISSVGQGIMVIKKMMSSKPILLVLDDVDHRDQLKALAGSASWFWPGSLIIFTGKDKQLLRSHRVDEIHDIDFLDEDESLKLFSFHAFEEKHPSACFQELAEKAVNYVQGHPLALIVLGCFLYGKTVGQWVSELERLKKHPNEEIHQVLRLSYDGLNLQQQNILLDIACLFVGENSDFVASILDGCNFFAVTNMQVLVDKSLITISSNNSLKMHDVIQAMAREIVREESIMTGKQRRLWNSSEVYNVFSEKKVPIPEAVEVLVLSLEKFSQKVQIDANDFARMKRLRILKIYQEEKPYEHKFELEGHNVIFSGKNLYHLSNELSLFYWHGCPFEYLPSDFYPENIVAIDLSYSNIKHFWTTPKSFRRLKVLKLRYCCNLTTTPDFSEITNLEELDLEGCVNLVTVHPSLNMRDCRWAASFPSKVETDSLQVLNRSGCLNGSLKPFGLDAGLKSLVILNQQHPQRSVPLPGSLSQLSNLQKLILDGCKKLEVLPELPHSLETVEARDCTSLREVSGSLTQLSNLRKLILDGCKKLEVLPELPHSLETVKARDCTSLREVSGSLTQLANLRKLYVDGCKKLEVLPELPHSLEIVNARGCTSLREVSGSLTRLTNLQDLYVDGCKKLEVLPELPHCLDYLDACDCTSLCSIKGSNPIMSRRSTYLNNCPKLFENLAIDSQVSISETECHDSSVTSQVSTNRFSSFLRYAHNRCGLFRLPGSSIADMLIYYQGNSIPNWFTNKSMGNQVKVELPLDWSFSKLMGYGICVVFKRKKPSRYFGYIVKNCDGAYLGGCYPYYYEEYFKDKPIRIDEPDMIWLHYATNEIKWWKKAKNFVTFCFFESEEIEVKEMGVRLVCDEDLDEETDLSMFQDLPTLSQHGGVLCQFGEYGDDGEIDWTW